MADLLARVAVAEAALATNTSNIATNASVIATNSSDIVAIGPHYKDNDAVAAIGPHYDDAQAIAAVGSHSPDLTADVSANTAAIEAVGPHYTDAEAIAAVGPHFSGKHDDLTNVSANQHHVPAVTDLTGIENAIAYYDDLLDGVSRSDDDPNTGDTDTLRFSGMNVQVVNGSNSTESVNGTGNLIIGYNELQPFGDLYRSGSHMLVTGKYNNYLSYGGMVVGWLNTASGDSASVSGGRANAATGVYDWVAGGLFQDQ